MFDDLGLFHCFLLFFGRREVPEAIDEFNDLPELYLRVFYCTSLEPFFFSFSFFFLFFKFVFAFYGVLCENCN